MKQNIKTYKTSLLTAFLLLAILVYPTIIKAQQDAQYTQYMFNTISINPAYAGSRGVTSIVGLHRSQWVGLEGAPSTQTIGIHSPVGIREKVGIGLSVVNDEIGPTQETYFDATFSYTLNLSARAKLSFGLKAGGHLLDVRFSELNQYTNTDVLLQQDIDNKFSPNVGAGVYYHNGLTYIGFSAPNLLETEHFDETNSSNLGVSFLARERINYYLMAGHIFRLSDQWKFKPAFLGKYVNGAPLQADLSASFLYNDKISFGAAYRWSAALSATAGFQFSDALMIGFAYDRESTPLGDALFNAGTFEVFLRFELARGYDKLISPRFF
ncbi:type IX secretion system membrane protein PorP/SprF [Spongiivirga sp. MCCC 1A20706]|uniref:PorP/SprF family type IX secretion system membrane protein n=1 Tax=Spongiivirga sp. MCCC 1A20706 TaxID=3160963 RepID=UPI0039773652